MHDPKTSEIEKENILLRYDLKIVELHKDLLLKQIEIVRKMAVFRRDNGDPGQGFGHIIKMTETMMDQFNFDYSEDENDEQVS